MKAKNMGYNLAIYLLLDNILHLDGFFGMVMSTQTLYREDMFQFICEGKFSQIFIDF